MQKTSIALSGKGGTGKTTLAALIVGVLKHQGRTPILAIDADANSTLHECLGVTQDTTIGALREEIMAGEIPEGMPKETFLEYRVQDALTEAEGFDLLVMGRSEGTGCYCYVNNVVRKYVDVLSKTYSAIVMDNEAGMEHLSRKTTQNMDYLLIVSDPSMRGINTAARIRDLAAELALDMKEVYLIVSRVPGGVLEPALEKAVADHGLRLAGVIPEDPLIMKFEIDGRPLFELPDSSVALKAVQAMLKVIFEGDQVRKAV